MVCKPGNCRTKGRFVAGKIMGFSRVMGVPKMDDFYKGNPIKMDDFWGYPYLGNHHINDYE